MSDEWARHAEVRAKFVEQVIPKGGVGAECGVFCGHFTRYLFDIAKPEKLHLIDPWYLLGETWEDWGVLTPTTEEAMTQVVEAYFNELASGQVKLHVGDDLKVLRGFADDYFDWVYIDTIHEYKQASKELVLVAPKMKAGGIIAGDDWEVNPAHHHHGVYQAVQEFVEREPWELIYADEMDLQWAIRRKGQS